jgi:mannose-6-phosphate isomerase-like protein (cupin superfamily)
MNRTSWSESRRSLPKPKPPLERSEEMRTFLATFLPSHGEATMMPASHDRAAEWLETRPGELCAIRVDAAETGGVYSFVEIISSPGDGTTMHVHQYEDEHIIVLEGIARVACGDKIFDAEAGKVVTLPRKIPHAWGNRSDSPLRIAVVAYPGGCEEALRVIARGDAVELPALAAKFGISLVGPTPF